MRAASCFCSTTRLLRSSGAGSGTRCVTGTTRTTRPRRSWRCSRPMLSAPLSPGASISMAERFCWQPSAAPRPPGCRPSKIGSWPTCWPKMPSSGSLILLCSVAWKAARTRRRWAWPTGLRPSVPPGGECSGTVRRLARSHCCARQEWIGACCQPSPTPRQPSRGCGCLAPTFPSSARPRSRPRRRTPCFCSSPTCAPRSRPPSPGLRRPAAGGSTLTHWHWRVLARPAG